MTETTSLLSTFTFLFLFLCAGTFLQVSSFLTSTNLVNFRSNSNCRYFSTVSDDSPNYDTDSAREATKKNLLSALASVPRNTPTPPKMTQQILSLVREMEEMCPTNDDDVLKKLGGNWELVWTSQDKDSPEGRKGVLRTFINPLENQSYSNNPLGRSNPILPREIQDKLEDWGILSSDTSSSSPVRSSQSVDLQKYRVRNVVAFRTPLAKGSLTVDIRFRPNTDNVRKINVKFESCRVKVAASPINFNLPLGAIGPTGWLRTDYIDDEMRITRGFKGSVFVLTRGNLKKERKRE